MDAMGHPIAPHGAIMPPQTDLDAQEAHLQRELRIARMKAQLGKARADLWIARLPMMAVGAVVLVALVCLGVLALAVAR